MQTPCLTLNLKALSYNATLAQTNQKVIAVVKNNAYNFGLNHVVKTFYQAGIRFFATTSLIDCITMRKMYDDINIMLLNPSTEFDTLRQYNIIATLPGLRFLQQYHQNMYHISYHLEWAGVMRRSGCRSEKEILDTLQYALQHDITVDGLWTHFAWADEFNGNYEIEREQWLNIVDKLSSLHQFNIIHSQNSASFVRENGLLNSKHTHVRLGIYLYGCLPYYNAPVKLEHALTLSTNILAIHTLNKDESVGYCNSFIAQKDHTKIAILNIGYGDGILRKRITNQSVLINNKLYPLVSLMMSHSVAIVDDTVTIKDTAIFYDKDLPVHYFTHLGVGANSEQISALNHSTLSIKYI